MLEQVDKTDLKSVVHFERVGSNPTSGTTQSLNDDTSKAH